ncbi:MAG: PaaI family thioesterase [Pseudomonadota bacterium]
MRLEDLPSSARIPDGFELAQSRGKFTNHNGPVFVASAPEDLRSGLYVLQRHCNSMGFLHGGMASAFADRALAVAVWSALRAPSVTLKLTLHFYETVPAGSWLEAWPILHANEDGIVHVSADMRIDGEVLAARADAAFRKIRRPR